MLKSPASVPSSVYVSGSVSVAVTTAPTSPAVATVADPSVSGKLRASVAFAKNGALLPVRLVTAWSENAAASVPPASWSGLLVGTA